MTNQGTGYIVTAELLEGFESSGTVNLAKARARRDGYAEHCNAKIFKYPEMTEVSIEPDYEYLVEWKPCLIEPASVDLRSAEQLTLTWSEVKTLHRREVGTTQWFPLSEEEVEALKEGSK